MDYLGYIVGAVLLAILLVIGGVVAFVLGYFFYALATILFDILSWTFGG